MIKIYGYIICQNLNAQNLSTFEFLAGRYMVMTYDQYNETPICGHPSKGQFTHRRHDTTRQHATRPVFSLPILSNGSVHTYAARPSLVVTTKSCDNKNRSGSDFCRVSQRQYQEN